MSAVAQAILLFVVLTDFAVLGTSRLSACIRAVAVQGVLLGALSFIDGGWSLHAVALGLGTIGVKAMLLPAFLRWAIRETSVRAASSSIRLRSPVTLIMLTMKKD